MSIEVRRTPGELAGGREGGAGKKFSRERMKHGAKQKSWCKEKSEMWDNHERVHSWPRGKHSLGGTCRSQAVVGGKQVGSEGLETICTDFPSKEAGCEWETYGGS